MNLMGIPIRVDPRCPPGFVGLVHIAAEPFDMFKRFLPYPGAIEVPEPRMDVFLFCAPDAVWRLNNLDDRRRGCPTDAEGWE